MALSSEATNFWKLPEILIANTPFLQMLHGQIQILCARSHMPARSSKNARDCVQWQLSQHAITFWAGPEDQRSHSPLLCLNREPANARSIVQCADLTPDHATDLAEAIVVAQSERDAIAATSVIKRHHEPRLRARTAPTGHLETK